MGRFCPFFNFMKSPLGTILGKDDSGKRLWPSTWIIYLCIGGFMFRVRLNLFPLLLSPSHSPPPFSEGWELALSLFALSLFRSSLFRSLLFRSCCSLSKEWQERMSFLSKEWHERFTAYEGVICSFKSDCLQIRSFHYDFPIFMHKTKEWIALHRSSCSL